MHKISFTKFPFLQVLIPIITKQTKTQTQRLISHINSLACVNTLYNSINILININIFTLLGYTFKQLRGQGTYATNAQTNPVALRNRYSW